MTSESAAALSAWESFYVIVGSSGGALIGLQFVVVTLIAERRPKTSGEALQAFATPTVVHLTGALAVSALMSVPWPGVVTVSMVLGACGLAGVIYSAIVLRRAHRQTEYRPVWQDWVWYGSLPAVAYLLLIVGAVTLHDDPGVAFFLIGAAALGLLLMGIHNAWDTVTHIVFHTDDDDLKHPAPGAARSKSRP
jgi:hypothetical protein